MKNQIHIGPGLDLPAEIVTQTVCVIGKRGVGKTTYVLRQAEQMIAAGLPVAVVDPVGVCWGLRSSADGKRPGLPVVIFGGDHADVPLEVGAGAVVADFLIEARQPAVIDLSLFRKGEQVRFMTDFAERLYHKNRAPLHLVLDEGDAFAPQRPQHDEARLLGAIEDLVRRGRARGIGMTLNTQRAAVVNKNVLTQCEVLVAFRSIAPQDRAAIDDWIKVHGTPAQREEMMASLPSLPVGTAWFWSPAWLNVFKRIAVAPRETFDSSATPKVGAKVTAPKALAEVDLAGLRDRMAATIERAKADDPKELRRRIAELEKQVAVKSAAAPAKVERVEVPMLTKDEQALLDANGKLLTEGLAHMKHVSAVIDTALSTLDKMLALFQKRTGVSLPPPMGRSSNSNGAAKPILARVDAGLADRKISGGERRIMIALAQHGRCAKSKLAILTGYAVGGGGFNNNLSVLRTAALIEGAAEIELTARGSAALGPFDLLPTGADLVEHWKRELPKAERTVLDVLHVAGHSLTKEGLAEAAGYEASGGGFNNALSKLRTLGLIEGRGELHIAEALR